MPWTLINLIDFYLVQHGEYDVPAMFRPDGGPYGRFNWDDPRDDEVAVRVAACGVCYSDYHGVNGDYPMIYPGRPRSRGRRHRRAGRQEGHAGQAGRQDRHVVDAVVRPLPRRASPDRASSATAARGCSAASATTAPTACAARRASRITQFSFLSGFSEYVVIPEDGCIPLDADIDLIKVPVVGCRAPTGIGAVINTAEVEPGSTALVVGLGGVGFNVIQGLKLAGAHLIIAADIVDKKRWALDWGATHYIDASKQDIVEEVLKITGIGVDYAFDAIGRGDVQSACVAATHKGGRVVWVGVAPHTPEVGRPRRHEHDAVPEDGGRHLLRRRQPVRDGAADHAPLPSGIVKLDELITKYYSLDQINDAFDDMLAGRNICGCIRMD